MDNQPAPGDSQLLGGPTVPLTGQRILIADDSAVARAILEDVLSGGGFRTQSIAASRDLPAAVAEFSPTLIFLPDRLADGSGLDALDALRVDGATAAIPVIVALARDSPETSVRAFKLGAADCVFKPFCGAEILARVGAALNRCGPRRRAPGDGSHPTTQPTPQPLDCSEETWRRLNACVATEFSKPLEDVVRLANRIESQQVGVASQAAFEVFSAFLAATRNMMSTIKGLEAHSGGAKKPDLGSNVRIDDPEEPLGSRRSKSNRSRSKQSS